MNRSLDVLCFVSQVYELHCRLGGLLTDGVTVDIESNAGQMCTSYIHISCMKWLYLHYAAYSETMDPLSLLHPGTLSLPLPLLGMDKVS